jgi:hypothetical protein
VHAERTEDPGDLAQLPRVEPSRSASAPVRRTTSVLTSSETSTSVVYAGTSRPYIADNRRAKLARSCH